MNTFKVKIDEKSLFYGIYNDYKRGQTATVSTPINQSKDRNKWHNDIMKLMDSGLGNLNIPQRLVDNCLNKTTSQANSKLVSLYEFKNIYIDGEELKTKSSFGLYIKQEIDEFIKDKGGKSVKNTHLGRMKLHYPLTLKYTTDGFNIDNDEVLKSILVQNGGFAFIVRGFEFDIDKKSLNFLTSIIGLKGILLSSVFKIKKGVGEKLIIDEIDLEAQDIYSDSFVIVSKNKKTIDTDFDALSKIRVENGKIGENFVYENIKALICEYAEEVFHASEKFPTSPYDIEYIEKGVKKYLEVKSTSGNKEIFNMSSGELKFMERYKKDYTLILVTDVKGEFPKTKTYDYKKIMAMRKEYPTTRFYAT